VLNATIDLSRQKRDYRIDCGFGLLIKEQEDKDKSRVVAAQKVTGHVSTKPEIATLITLANKSR